MNGENYQILRSSVDVMTSFKFLIVSFVLLALAWVPDRAATDPDSTAEATDDPSTATTTTPHRKHHRTSTSATSSNSATASASEGTGTSGKTAKSGKTGKSTASTDKTTSGAGKTPASSDKNETAGTGKSGNSTSGKTSDGSTASTSATGKLHHTKKHHTGQTGTAAGSETASTSETKSSTEKTGKVSTTKTSTTPAAENASAKTAETTNAPTAIGAAAAAATVVNTQTAVAPSGKTLHHHHGKTTAASAPKVPEPPIVISPGTVPPLPTTTTPPLGLPPAPGSLVPMVQTGLPVARPGAGTTATLPLAMIRNPVPIQHFNFPDLPAPKTRTYPWKRGIVTTVFWIGEGATPLSSATNKMSAWDMNWVHDNGGADDQYDMSGYASGSHASLINPFYVALPFNDLAYPDKTRVWLPAGWYKPAHHGEKQQSSCQGRWVEIKTLSGRSCFAQWEDVGPIETDDAEYVFGSARPAASRGLDVSPAVAKYLGFDSSAITSWRFVDDDDVPPGLWLRYNEQAILFQALREQARRSTPIQDLSQPVPDGADDSHSEKEIRAGRG